MTVETLTQAALSERLGCSAEAARSCEPNAPELARLGVLAELGMA
jgi:hypothetical protein